MDIEEKTKFIDHVLGFLFGEPFMNAAQLMPSAEGEIESWFKHATVFERVRVAANVPDEHKEALNLLVEGAITELTAARFIGEPPDQEEELGVGYVGYDVPDGFAARLQKLVWKEVLDVFSS